MTVSARIGSIELIGVSDGSFTPPASGFMPAIPEEAWQPYRAEYMDDQGRLSLNLGSWVVRAGGQTILIDTGIGPGNPRLPGGTLLSELTGIGVNPEDINQVLVTHMHLDHIGTNTKEVDGKRVPVFPNARYVINRKEWDFWTTDTAAKDLIERQALPIQAAGLLDLVDEDHKAAPGISYLSTPGHTPGHVCVLLESGNEKAVVLGDVAHTPIQVSEPDWSVSADTDQELGRQTRRALWDRIEAEGWQVAAGHFGGHNLGRIIRVEGKRWWRGG